MTKADCRRGASEVYDIWKRKKKTERTDREGGKRKIIITDVASGCLFYRSKGIFDERFSFYTLSARRRINWRRERKKRGLSAVPTAQPLVPITANTPPYPAIVHTRAYLSIYIYVQITTTIIIIIIKSGRRTRKPGTYANQKTNRDRVSATVRGVCV